MEYKKLREYQQKAVDETALSLIGNKEVVIVAPTGSGKSLIIAAIAKRCLDKGLRVLVLAPKGFLLEQNGYEFLDHVTQGLFALNLDEHKYDYGIYCAGLGKKETDNKIIFASRDSLGRSPDVCGKFDVIICDECHGIPLNVLKQDGMYHRIFKYQLEIGRPLVVGLTATPWRLSGGLIYGKDKFFKTCAYTIGLDYLIESGFLSEYCFPSSAFEKVDVSGIKIVRGDYREADLNDILGEYEQIDASVRAWVDCGGRESRCSLFFCCSVYHAKRFVKRLGNVIDPSAIAYIDGSLIGKDRNKLLGEIKSGKYKAVINIGVLTEGFDAPNIDCIVFCRPTASASLFVQMAGRGLRNDSSNPDKKCLFIDIAGNFDRFQSLSRPVLQVNRSSSSSNSKLGWDMPLDLNERDCLQCGSRIPQGMVRCLECYDFKKRELDIVHNPYTLDPITYRVRETYLERYTTKNGEESIKVHYFTEGGYFNQYLLINRSGRFGEINRKIYDELLNFNMSPSLLSVTNIKDSKYKTIKIVDWIANNRYSKSDNNLCRHPWVDSVYSNPFLMLKGRVSRENRVSVGNNFLLCASCGSSL